MTLAGWIFMTISLSAVLALVTLCYWKVLSAPAELESEEDPRETSD